jgi:hypothetical protein
MIDGLFLMLRVSRRKLDCLVHIVRDHRPESLVKRRGLAPPAGLEVSAVRDAIVLAGVRRCLN